MSSHTEETLRPSMGSLLQQAARCRPGQPALLDERCCYTFDALETLSMRFAEFLLSRGLQRGDRVAFCAAKSAPLVVAILGCLKAGGVYVPIDAKLPKDRLLFILRDTAPRFIVSSAPVHQAAAAESANPLEWIDEARLEECLRHESPSVVLPEVAPDDVAYCIYTSGSTGRPKGVLIEHGSVATFYRALAEIMPLDADSVCMNTSELYFDVHVMDLFFPLHRGATVHLSCGPLVANRLLRTIEEKRVTHFTAVGPVMTLMAEARTFESRDLSSLVRVMTGAEIVNVATMQKWLRRVPGLSLVNGYGPTEATVICSYYIIDQIEPGRSEFYPIGRPLGDVRLLLLDGEHVVSEPGCEGELLIGGAQVMRGYWNNDAQTQERIRTLEGVRFYRSGDVCCWLPDGNLHYVGRNDEEIKLSGFRIHLNEIKRVMDGATYVREGQALVVVHPALGRVIAAGFTLDPAAAMSEDAFDLLQSRFRDELPYYMVPSLYFHFDDFPRLPSGKTDKGAISAAMRRCVEAAPAGRMRFACGRKDEWSANDSAPAGEKGTSGHGISGAVVPS